MGPLTTKQVEFMETQKAYCGTAEGPWAAAYTQFAHDGWSFAPFAAFAMYGYQTVTVLFKTGDPGPALFAGGKTSPGRAVICPAQPDGSAAAARQLKTNAS